MKNLRVDQNLQESLEVHLRENLVRDIVAVAEDVKVREVQGDRTGQRSTMILIVITRKKRLEV